MRRATRTALLTGHPMLAAMSTTFTHGRLPETFRFDAMQVRRREPFICMLASLPARRIGAAPIDRDGCGRSATPQNLSRSGTGGAERALGRQVAARSCS